MELVPIKVVIDNQTVHGQVKDGGDPLKDLCRKEVERFHEYLVKFGGDYKEGLSKWERWAIEGYLYQKIRGHIDEVVPPIQV